MDNNHLPPDPNWEQLLDQLEAGRQGDKPLSEAQLHQLNELRRLVSVTTEAFQVYGAADVDKGWQKLRSAALERSLIADAPAIAWKQRLWPGMGIWIAATLALVIAGVWFFNGSSVTDQARDQKMVRKDIAPGTFGATLTLADGRKIELDHASNGELDSAAGVTITKSAQGELVYEVKPSNETSAVPAVFNTLSTAKGQTYQVILPDGSRIWLNAASSITYSTHLLQDGKRVVRLRGEAYFQIQKDGAHPFIVESPGQRVEVLGTHFNINSYTDEKRIRTTLLEGSVKVISLETGKSTTIQPDQQAIWDGKNLQVVPVIAEESIDWKEGVFSFEDEGLQSVMRKVARWYDVEIEYRGTAHDRQTFSGSISRSENISQVLKTLSKISSLDFQMENRKIIISSQSR
jgi:ferric-dicitrate binding protein FerR (iron transport regulator)